MNKDFVELKMNKEKITTYIYVRCSAKLKNAVSKFAKAQNESEANFARMVLQAYVDRENGKGK